MPLVDPQEGEGKEMEEKGFPREGFCLRYNKILVTAMAQKNARTTRQLLDLRWRIVMCRLHGMSEGKLVLGWIRLNTHQIGECINSCRKLWGISQKSQPGYLHSK